MQGVRTADREVPRAGRRLARRPAGRPHGPSPSCLFALDETADRDCLEMCPGKSKR